MNFVTHRDSAISFEEAGSFFISGVNRDNKSMSANAVGKSLVIDSFFVCFFGRGVRPSPPDGFIGDFTKWCSVSWDFTVSGSDLLYRITRYRRHPKLRNRPVIQTSADGGATWSDDSGKETATDTDKYICRLIGMTYDTAVSVMLLTKLDPELNFCMAKDSRRKEVLTNLLDLGWIDLALKRAREDVLRLSLKDERLSSAIREESGRLAVYRREISEARTNDREFSENRRREMKEIRSEIHGLSAGRPVVRMMKERERLIAKVAAAERGVASVKNTRMSLIRKAESLKTKSSGLSEARDRMMSVRQKLRHSAKSHRSGSCYLCGSKIDAGSFEEETRRLSAKLTPLKREFKRLKNISDKVVKVEAMFLDVAKLLQVEQDALVAAKGELSSINSSIDALDSLTRRLERVSTQANSWGAAVSRLTERISVSETEISDLEESRSKIAKKLSEARYAVEAFGPSGLKNDIISSKIEELERTINEYLGIIADGDMYVRLDNKVRHGQSERIGFMIKDSKKTRPVDFMVWSGGQRTRIRFATELAISTIQSRPTPMIFVDEGFDELDELGVKFMLGLLSKSKERKVVCISNRPDMQKQNVFRNRIVVTIDGDVSTIKQTGA